MGHHHDQRFNISGYKGSELGFTPEELGHSFKQGIQDFVQEFQSQYKSMIIRHEIDPILEAQGFRKLSTNSCCNRANATFCYQCCS